MDQGRFESRINVFTFVSANGFHAFRKKAHLKDAKSHSRLPPAFVTKR